MVVLSVMLYMLGVFGYILMLDKSGEDITASEVFTGLVWPILCFLGLTIGVCFLIIVVLEKLYWKAVMWSKNK